MSRFVEPGFVNKIRLTLEVTFKAWSRWEKKTPGAKVTAATAAMATCLIITTEPEEKSEEIDRASYERWIITGRVRLEETMAFFREGSSRSKPHSSVETGELHAWSDSTRANHTHACREAEENNSCTYVCMTEKIWGTLRIKQVQLDLLKAFTCISIHIFSIARHHSGKFQGDCHHTCSINDTSVSCALNRS